MSADFESVLLTDQHDVAAFDCGVDSLNRWLAGEALRAQSAGTARTFVWAAVDAPDRLCAYFSLAPTEVARDSLTRGQSSGYQTVPAYQLARLALHVDLHGRGYGGQVLVDALSRAARAADSGGGRLIVVDALDGGAADFYRHFGFTPVKGNPRRLVLKVATVQALIVPRREDIARDLSVPLTSDEVAWLDADAE